jgi:YidC/Oxa1 family membrane protein insertase
VGWGTSIVLLTVIVRAAMAPLTVKQFKSMRAMAAVAPELKKLQAKYKDDKQRQQQEIMKFYSENKINPFASCLPLLAQFPFFIGLYYLLQSDLRREICGRAAGVVADAATGKLPPCGQIPNPTGDEKFLFIPDLTAGATGWVLAVLMLLYVGSQLLSTVLTPSTPDRNQQMLMYGLPLVFSIFILLYEFPAGLLVYWITTNLWTVGQGYLLRKKLGPIMPPKEPSGDDDGGGGSFLSKVTSGVMRPKEPVAATTTSTTKTTPSGPPPRPPRKKKKRSGRRR